MTGGLTRCLIESRQGKQLSEDYKQGKKDRR